jgi:hypothetical protein
MVWLFGIRWGVDIDLQLLKFLVDEAQRGCHDWVGDFDALQSENAELELVEGAWCSVLQGLNFEEENRSGCVDAVGEREDDVAVSVCSAV